MRIERYTLMSLVSAASIVAAVQWRKAALFQQDNEKLRAEIGQLEQAAEAATNSTERLTTELTQMRKQHSELMSLRNEVGQLRAVSKTASDLNSEVARLRQENQQLAQKLTTGAAQIGAGNSGGPGNATPDRFSRDSWNFAGYNTPENALVSAIWAMKQGDPQTYLQSLTPEEQARITKSWAGKTEQEIAQSHQSDVAQINGIRILDRQEISPTQMRMNVYLEGQNRMATIMMNQSGNEWKYGGVVDQPAQQKTPAQ
jgi:uncharacterized protein YhaN